MKLVNASTGKIGHFHLGPKVFLHERIRLGEIAICIARDEIINSSKPSIWIIGSIEPIIDYIFLARSSDTLSMESCNYILAQLDSARKQIPLTPIARLASVTGISDIDELRELLDIAQICITAPIGGVVNFADSKVPKWTDKANTPLLPNNHASFH